MNAKLFLLHYDDCLQAPELSTCTPDFVDTLSSLEDSELGFVVSETFVEDDCNESMLALHGPVGVAAQIVEAPHQERAIPEHNKA